MRPRRREVIGMILAALGFAGCAAYRPEPLSTSHPAHPQALASRERPPSQALASTPSDLSSVRPVPPVAASTPHGEHHAAPPAGGGPGLVVGEGDVVATVPQANQIVVDHGEIQGFMEAMTMGYRVDPASLLAGLAPGDRVRFTIDVQRRAIVKIEKLP
jgi:Cu/Ag efflux protein CusF